MAKDSNYPSATRIVNRWHSKCNNCGEECYADHPTHDKVLGYNMERNGQPGCGIKFEYELDPYSIDGLRKL